MHGTASILGTSRQIAQDGEYWECLQLVLTELTECGDFRAAVPYLDEMAHRLARVEAVDRVHLPMMGELLHPHRQLAERSLFRVANHLWDLDRQEFPEDVRRSPRRHNFLRNVAKVAACTGSDEKSGFYHFLVAAASAEATAAAAVNLEEVAAVAASMRERSMAM